MQIKIKSGLLYIILFNIPHFRWFYYFLFVYFHPLGSFRNWGFVFPKNKILSAIMSFHEICNCFLIELVVRITVRTRFFGRKLNFWKLGIFTSLTRNSSINLKNIFKNKQNFMFWSLKYILILTSIRTRCKKWNFIGRSFSFFLIESLLRYISAHYPFKKTTS